MATYTQTEGTADDTYFHDVKINPETVADGSLVRRFDPKRYPKVGVKTAINQTVDSVLPATLVHGLGTTLTVLGDQFSDDTVVTFSGAGITVVSTTNVDNEGTQLQVAITSTVGAAIGARDLIVTNPDGGTYTVEDALTLLVTPVTVTLAAPATVAQGSTGDVTITGSGFNAAPVASISGAGVTVNTTTRTNATTLVANITVTGGAALTARDVTVTNTDTGSATGTGLLTVTA